MSGLVIQGSKDLSESLSQQVINHKLEITGDGKTWIDW